MVLFSLSGGAAATAYETKRHEGDASSHPPSGTFETRPAPSLERSPTARLVEAYTRATSHGLYGPFQVGSARSFVLPHDRDLRVSTRALVRAYVSQPLEAVTPPDVTTRGELMRALAPLVARLGVDVDARHIETVLLLSALADVLYDGADERLIPCPRFVFMGDDPSFHPRYARAHLVVLDPRGASRGPRSGGELVWLSGTRVRVGDASAGDERTTAKGAIAPAPAEGPG